MSAANPALPPDLSAMPEEISRASLSCMHNACAGHERVHIQAAPPTLAAMYLHTIMSLLTHACRP
eukprot:1139617-Pelagomonas_calceolata.AAC.11